MAGQRGHAYGACCSDRCCSLMCCAWTGQVPRDSRLQTAMGVLATLDAGMLDRQLQHRLQH